MSQAQGTLLRSKGFKLCIRHPSTGVPHGEDKPSCTGKFVYETLSISDENEKMDQEEDRVLYVAMTRAKDLLILSSLEKVILMISNLNF